MRVIKYQGLGNDYLVTEAGELPSSLSPAQIRRICDRHYGIGSDGIIVRQPRRKTGPFSIHIYNPDGSWVEKSGNGLRIFSRYLWDRGEVGEEPFEVETPGGTVTCRVIDEGNSVMVQMGRAVFESGRIPVTGPPREVLRESIEAAHRQLEVSAVSMGNPHCVVHRDRVAEKEARELGPHIENHPLFPERTNVQFMEILDRRNIKIEIWERGAGYTLASGTSSCAVCAVARRLGLCDPAVIVHMPGGELQVQVREGFQMHLQGPVGKVFEAEYFS
jgi:diaminopimelate epimerase